MKHAPPEGLSSVYTTILARFRPRLNGLLRPDRAKTALSLGFKEGRELGAFISRCLREFRHFIWNQILWQKETTLGRIYPYLRPVIPHVSLILVFLFGFSLQFAGGGLVRAGEEYALEPRDIAVAIEELDRYTPYLNEDRTSVEVAFRSHEVLEKPEIPETVAASKTKKTSEYLKIQARHKVEKGETVSKVAGDFGIHVASVLAANDIPFNQAEALHVGQELDIPAEDFDTSDAWLEYLNEQRAAEEAARRKAEATRLADRARRLAKTAVSPNVALASGPADGATFSRPAEGHARNGYHSWAVDISGGGRTIWAAADGVVAESDEAGYNGGYGRFLEINHGNGFSTLYGHNSDNLVRPGERVTKGQPIAVMGATGRVYPRGATHLHFEIQKNGRRLNPCHLMTIC